MKLWRAGDVTTLTPEEFLEGLNTLEKIGKDFKEFPSKMGVRHLNGNFDFLELYAWKFEEVRRLIETYKDRDNDKTIDERYDWLVITDPKTKQQRRVETVGELARYCVDLVQEAYQFLGQKEVEKIVYKDKPVSKSIDKAVFYVATLGVFQTSATFFVAYGNPKFCGILGLGTFIFGLLMIQFKQKFFLKDE